MSLKKLPTYEALTIQEVLGEEANARPDALRDDFNIRLIAKQLSHMGATEEGGRKAAQSEAAARDEKVAKDAKYLMWTWIG